MNPELRRNLWLELTPHRLLLMPGVILGIALLFHYVDPSDSVVRPVALFGFVLLAVIWGARQAANSILDEARDRTWDIQRMSALSPWTMTWGKLAGATVMSWYGGAWCLLVYAGGIERTQLTATAMACALVILAAIAAQSATLTGALIGLHLGRRAQTRLSNLVVILLLIFLLPNLLQIADAKDSLVWYGQPYAQLAFALGSALMLATWAVVGAVRTMCIELKLRTRPWVWILFILFIAWYLTGFSLDTPASAASLARRLSSSATAVAVILSYVAAFAFVRDPIQYRRVSRALGERRFGRALEELPLWLASALLAIALGVLTLALGSAPEITNALPYNLGAVALAFVCMMLRDLALLTYFSLRSHPARAAATTLIYIAILDLLLPALLSKVGLDGIAALVRPRLFDAPLMSVLVLFAQAGVAAALAVRAYRAVMAAISRADDR